MMVVFISYYEVVVPILIGCDDCSYFNILYLKGGFKMEQWQFERIAEVFYCFFKEKIYFLLRKYHSDLLDHKKLWKTSAIIS